MSPSLGSCPRTPSFPTPRIPPFPGSPAFSRYYEGAKTPLPPALVRLYLTVRSRGVDWLFFGPIASRPSRWVLGRCFPVSPCSGVGSLVWFGSPVFHGLPSSGLPCSSTPPAPLDLALFRSSGFAPSSSTTKASGNIPISWLNHTAFHLAVYASCRPFRTTMQDSLTVRRYSLSGGIWTRLGGAAAFPPRFQPPGFALLFCLSVSFICFLSFPGYCLRCFPAAMPFTAPRG